MIVAGDECKYIKNTQKHYAVSKDGNVWSFYHAGRKRKIPKRLKAYVPKGNGYLTVCLCVNNNRKNVSVHRLVAEAFIPNDHNLPCVNHKDENKFNNCVENLEWCTFEYNNKYGTKGTRISKSKMRTIGQYTDDGQLVRTFLGQEEAGKALGRSKGAVCNMMRGVTPNIYNLRFID